MHKIDLNRYGHEKEIRTFCNNQGLSVVFEDKHRPRTDGKRIYVGTPDPTWSEDEIVKWKFSIYHEMGHNVKEMRDCFDVAKEKNIDMQSFLGSTLNLIDDYRQEHHKYDEYYGRQQIMERGRSIVTDEVYINNPKFGTIQDNKWQALETLVAWEAGLREEWQRSMAGKGEKIAAKLSLEQQEWLEKLKQGDYADVLNNNPTAFEEYDLVKRMLDEVFKIDSEAEEKAAQKPSDSGEGEGDSSEEGNSEGASGEGDAKGGDKDGKRRQRTKKATVKYEDLLVHKHDETNVRSGTSYAPLEIDYTGYTQRVFNPRPTNRMKLIDYKEGIEDENTHYTQEIVGRMNESGLVKQLKKLLQVYKQAINIHGQKKGRLSKRSIYRATVKELDGYSQKIFKKRIDSDILDSSVLVLTDCSGSMGGSKFTYAARTAIMLNNAVSKLGMPIEVLGFSESNTPVHAVFKGFNENLSGDTIAQRFSSFSNGHMGSNSDGESILWSLPRLLSQKTSKKIMIVLSDGQPASSSGDAMTFTKEVVKEIEKRKDMEIYGIGICSSTVKEIYKHNYVINRPEEIETAVMNIIKSRLINTH